jgi:hypothetical protein
MLTGIQVIHWLFKERIPANQQHSWISTMPMASVKVIKHNHVSQMITIEASDPVVTTAPVSGKRNVGLTLAEARKVTTVKFGNRKKCDTCMFFNRNTGAACEIVEDKVCENCLRLYGRPFCSWTPGIPAVSVPGNASIGNSFEQLESNGDTANALRREALHGLKGWSGDAILAADPIMIAIDAGEEIDAMSDTELDAAERGADEHDGEWLGP